MKYYVQKIKINDFKLYVSTGNLYGKRQPSLKNWKDLGLTDQYEFSTVFSFRCSKLGYYAASLLITLFTIPT